MNSNVILHPELSRTAVPWLRRVKGLIDTLQLPSAFPAKRLPVPLPTPGARWMQGRAALVFKMLQLAVRLRFNQRFRPAKLPQVVLDLAMIVTQLQGFWVDLVQLLAQRDGFLSLELRQQLLAHCHTTPGSSGPELESILQQNLGMSVDTLFSRLDIQPVRATRFADTYRARLRREDVEIELKVRRADLETSLRRDLDVFRVLSKIMHSFQGSKKNLLDYHISLCMERLPALLDLRYEASAMRRMKSSLHEHKFYVAKLFRAYAGKRLLVKEHIEAPTLQQLLDLRVSDPSGAQAWLQANGISLEKLARRLYHSTFRQICEDNFFNQNLTPSNIVLLRDSRLGVLSCDATGSVDKRFLTIFNLAMTAISRDAYEKFADTLFLLCESLPVSDLSAVRAEVIRTVRTHAARSVLESASHYEKSILKMANDISVILDCHGIVLDAQLNKIMLALGSIDAGVHGCDPHMDHRSEMARYAKKAASRRMRQVVAGGFGKALLSVVGPLSEMVRFETASMRKKAQTFRATSTKLSYLGTTLVKWLGRALLAGGVAAVWIYLHQHQQGSVKAFRGTPASDYALNLAWLPSSWWILIFASIVVIYRVIRQIERRLSDKEVDVEQGAF